MPTHSREWFAAVESRRKATSSSGLGVTATAWYTARSTAPSSRSALATGEVAPRQVSNCRASTSSTVCCPSSIWSDMTSRLAARITRSPCGNDRAATCRRHRTRCRPAASFATTPLFAVTKTTGVLRFEGTVPRTAKARRLIAHRPNRPPERQRHVYLPSSAHRPVPPRPRDPNAWLAARRTSLPLRIVIPAVPQAGRPDSEQEPRRQAGRPGGLTGSAPSPAAGHGILQRPSP